MISLANAMNGSGSHLVEFLHWIRSNPIASLTAAMVCITAYYARATTRYVKIASEQFAAQIEPVPIIELRSCAWTGGSLLCELVIEAAQNTLVINGGSLFVRCEHGRIRPLKELDKWLGHTLNAGERLSFVIEALCESNDGFHTQLPLIEGVFIYQDSRNVAGYRREILPSGVVRIHRQRELGKLATWMLVQTAFFPTRLRMWKVRIDLAILRAKVRRHSKRGIDSNKRFLAKQGSVAIKSRKSEDGKT